MKNVAFMQKWMFIIFFFLVCNAISFAQEGSVFGKVLIEGSPIEFANISLENSDLGTTSNRQGKYLIEHIPHGRHTLIISYVGYEDAMRQVVISNDKPEIEVNVDLEEKRLTLDAIVVTGTKTFKRKTNSPIIVNILSSETLNNVQACNLSEGLKFQPGLRVETDCQTCNYTQLRMNGLGGGYAQILINGRPIFSPLMGLYGLEQLPVNMIERIEVIRGGGSSLYGSSAVGGTVNVITKLPRENGIEIDYNYQNINGQTSDHQLTGNSTWVAPSQKTGATFFVNHRKRGLYDHNDDQFSEIPLIQNTSAGVNLFFLPTENQKLEVSLSSLNEYRFGGEMKLDIPVHLTQQAEERTHHVWMGSADYQLNFNGDRSSIIGYIAGQQTNRKHYTGILPDDFDAHQEHIVNPPYGTSEVSTLNAGMQLNHRLPKFLNGVNTLTFGSEYIYDDVFDEIDAYNYVIDQTTKNLGLFLQSDWEVLPTITLLSGVRMDVHNLMEKPTLSPRASLLFKIKSDVQFRLNYGTGFRAPQAFDTDLHIAFAGGGVSRVTLSPDLSPEKSHSYSGSINYDKVAETFIAGFTLEGFNTRLQKAFYLHPIGQDNFGERYEKRNGQGATVQGVTLELRANYNRMVQLETGFTLQSSRFDEPVQYIDELDGIREFVRTPNQYGFGTLSITPKGPFSGFINYVYTGEMKIPHFGGAPNQTHDELITSNSFSQLGFKLGYTVGFEKLKSNLEFYTGIQNVFNALQPNFDIGKNRDSNFVYGPSQPRTFFVGVKWRS